MIFESQACFEFEANIQLSKPPLNNNKKSQISVRVFIYIYIYIVLLLLTQVVHG